MNVGCTSQLLTQLGIEVMVMTEHDKTGHDIFMYNTLKLILYFQQIPEAPPLYRLT